MKNKNLLLVCLVLVAVVLIGCSSDKKDVLVPEEERIVEPEQGELLSKPYANLFGSGKYYMKYKLVSDNTEVEPAEDPDTVYEIFIDGDKMSNITLVGDQKLQNIVVDGQMFIIMHDQRMIITTEIPQNIRQNTGIVETKGMEYQGSGRTEFAGIARNYEEYISADGYETIRYIFDGDRLVGLQVSKALGQAKYDMEILEINGNVTIRAFDLPSDYAMVN